MTSLGSSVNILASFLLYKICNSIYLTGSFSECTTILAIKNALCHSRHQFGSVIL